MIGRIYTQLSRFSSTRPIAKATCMAATAVILASCSGGGGGGGNGDDYVTEPGEDAPDYLVASVPDFYFGTRNVGTAATQQIELSNRSGDIYPIKRLELLGENAEEFETNFIGEITLNPAEKIMVDVSFEPLTDGKKVAALHVEYDIIKQVTEEANQNEQNFYRAAELEKSGQLEESAKVYKTYLKGAPETSNKRKAAIKFPVLSESERHGKGPDFQMYLDAVNQRDSNDHIGAISRLNELLIKQPESIYADDALYMRGYIQLMDSSDYRGARDTMQKLRNDYPDTKYYDTALFSEALANDEMGEKNRAGDLYKDLKDRHTSEGAKILSLDLPKDNYLSRLWFDRAKQGLSRTSGEANLL